jgi:biopolymer transport protein ExbD
MSGGGGEVEEDSGHGPGANVFGEEAPAQVTLNLTALMDILSNLLFFLLACFGTTIVMGINATTPVQSDKSSVADTRQTVTAGITVGKTGYDVTIIGQAQTQDELDRWRRRIPLKNGVADLDALTSHLLAIKQNYPKSDTMILTPDPGIPYEVMVQTMDAARETNVTVTGTPHLLALFPTVVVSTVIK